MKSDIGSLFRVQLFYCLRILFLPHNPEFCRQANRA